jgi:hypothetical protein
MRVILAAIMGILGLCGSASAQQPEAVFHVTSVHNATEAEKTYRTAFNMVHIEGTIGNQKYVLSQLKSWGAYHFNVGQDYPVIEVKSGNPDRVKLQVPNKFNKKGKKPFMDETLSVITVEEVAAK